MARRPTLPGFLSTFRHRPQKVASEQIYVSGMGGFGGGSGAPGDPGDPGVPGAAGRDAGFSYTYLTDTANTDPGTGKLKFDSTTFASITTLRISETDGDGNTLFNFLATLDDPASTIRGHILMRKVGAPGTFALFSITGALTDNGTWDSLTIAHIVSAGSFADNDPVVLNFARTGDKGDTGATGSPGAPGAASTADWKDSVRAAAPANITIATALNNGDTLDGVVLATNDRVLVPNQTSQPENGLYVVGVSPARATDADAAGELSGGTKVTVEEGNVYGGRTMRISTPGSITPGTTAHTWIPDAPKDFGLVTALPANPITGDCCTYTDSLSAPTYRWRLQYNGSSASSSKWEYIGGTPMFAEVVTTEARAVATYAALTTAGPSITVPLAGDYDVQVGTRVLASSTNQGLHSYDIGGTGAVDADAVTQFPAATAGGQSGSRPRRKTGVAASTALVSKYRPDGAVSVSFSNRWMRVTPVRIG